MIPGIAPEIITRAAAADPLAKYYGTGDGEIIIDWDFSDAGTVSVNGSNEITAVLNKGGLGIAHDLEPSSGLPLKYGAGGFVIENGSTSGLKLVTPLQLAELHLLTVTRGERRNVITAGYAYPEWSVGTEIPCSRSRDRVNCSGVNQYSVGGLPPGDDSGYGRHELRLNDDEVGMLVVARMNSYAPSGPPSFVATYLSCTTGQGAPADAIRRLVAVRQASGYSAASLEPAVLAARAVMQADADALNGG